jgi:hypothetical protein
VIGKQALAASFRYPPQPQALWAQRGWAVPPQPQLHLALPVGFDGRSEMFSSFESNFMSEGAADLEQEQALCAQAGWAVPPQPQLHVVLPVDFDGLETFSSLGASDVSVAAEEQEQPLCAQAGCAVPPHPQAHFPLLGCSSGWPS